MTKDPVTGATGDVRFKVRSGDNHLRRETMHTTARSSREHRGATASLAVVVLALLGLLSTCTSNGGTRSDTDDGGTGTGGSSGSVAADPVEWDDRGLPDGRDGTAVPWDEIEAGWTLAAYDPGVVEDARTAGLFLIAPDGRRWAVTTVDLNERDDVGVEDWLPNPPQAIVAHRHLTGIDENPQPGGLDLVDLETGQLRTLTAIHAVQANIATLSRPTGRVVVFAEGVGGPLQRRSSDFELLSTLAEEAFDWVHSPDGGLVAVGTLPSTGLSRLTVNANDTGAELIEMPVPSAFRFCHPLGWWDAVTLSASCGNTGVVQPAILWQFPLDGAPPQQLLTAEGSAVTRAAQQPDGTWLLATTDGALWTAGDEGTKLADLPDDARLIGASTIGALIVADGELLTVEVTGGPIVVLLPRRLDASGVVSAVTLAAGDFVAQRPAGADGVPVTDERTVEPVAPAPRAPTAGTVLDVVGIRLDDALNFRVDPDPSADIVVTAHPDVLERPENAVIIATGEATSRGTAVWWQVTVDGQEAWANSRYLGVLGSAGNAPELIDLEAIGDTELEDVVAEARPPTDATGVLLDVVGQDAISTVFTIDVLGSYGNGLKGERFDIEAWNVKAADPETMPQVIGAKIMTATRMPICEFGVDSGGGCL